MMKMLKKNKKGFTLIELIVVIAILAILAAVAIPRFAGFQESAKQKSDEQIASILANAAAVYYAENNALPANTGAITALVPYANDAAVIAALKSDKYKGTGAVAAGSVTYAAAAAGTGTVTVTIIGPNTPALPGLVATK